MVSELEEEVVGEDEVPVGVEEDSVAVVEEAEEEEVDAGVAEVGEVVDEAETAEAASWCRNSCNQIARTFK